MKTFPRVKFKGERMSLYVDKDIDNNVEDYLLSLFLRSEEFGHYDSLTAYLSEEEFVDMARSIAKVAGLTLAP